MRDSLNPVPLCNALIVAVRKDHVSECVAWIFKQPQRNDKVQQRSLPAGPGSEMMYPTSYCPAARDLPDLRNESTFKV